MKTLKTETTENPITDAPATEAKKKVKLTPEERQTKVANLLTELGKFPKGERASKGAKKIRRALRNLGHYISLTKMVAETKMTVTENEEATA